jgi:phospholipid N-methyltransferase
MQSTLTKAPLRNQLSLFARNFIKHPKMLGSAIPSSRFLVNQLLDQVNWARTDLIIEYGPGVGTITRHILERMRPEAKLLVIEMNTEFSGFLHETIDDPRLLISNGSAADVERLRRKHRLPKANYIISGIPFSSFSDRLRRDIVTATRASLAPGGEFLVYQFSGKVLPDLKRTFKTVRQEFEPLNILPARLFYCSG